MSNLDTINALIQAVVSLAPKFLEDPKDFEIAQGNLALYILDSEGNMYGRMFGDDRSKQRVSGRTAWHKVTQVWLTNKPTGVYEKLVYNNEVNWWEFGVPKNEFIGWEGGMPAVLEDGTRLAIAISGMYGETDRQLIRDAAAKVGGIKIIEG